MIRLNIIVALQFCFISTNGQNIECDLLKTAIETDLFKKEFTVCNIDSTIKIFDKQAILNTCLEYMVCERPIKVNHDTLYDKITPGVISTASQDKSLIIFYDMNKEKNKYTLMFWRPYSGANLHLTFRVKKGKVKLIKHIAGSF